MRGMREAFVSTGPLQGWYGLGWLPHKIKKEQKDGNLAAKNIYHLYYSYCP